MTDNFFSLRLKKFTVYCRLPIFFLDRFECSKKPFHATCTFKDYTVSLEVSDF
jgi:hypothetical protein